MTLGKLIAALEQFPADAPVANLTSPNSYRGYYRDLAFAKGPGTRPAGELLEECRSAMGREFYGWKGGDYLMGENTPVWIATYGDCGPRLMALNADGSIDVAEEE